METPKAPVGAPGGAKVGMTRAEAIKAWEGGAMIFLAEFRMAKGAHISWRDKAGSGKILEADVLTCTVETADASIPVSVRLPEGVTNAEQYALELPFTKGDKVIVKIDSMQQQKGLILARGELHPLVK